MAPHEKKDLTPLQYEVTQCSGTEPPFDNEYWDNKEEGIYVDVVSGEPLFSSVHKYDSQTGWPSFYQPLDKTKLVEVEDRTLARVRTEVRSKTADSHLGHVFDDGPAPTGKRYCMNSAALKFIPKADLEKEGYGQYLYLFNHHKEAIAYFAGGCFWCVEDAFLKIKGVTNVISGYIGGDEENPSYQEVSTGATKFAEAVEVYFDPDQISYDDLLKVFWLNIDPTVIDRQFVDVGHQYRTAIFYTDDAQAAAIKKSLSWLKTTFPNITAVTEISAAKKFYAAEKYHQRFAEKNPAHYQAYSKSCGRKERLDEIYGEKRKKLLENFVPKNQKRS